MGLTFHGLRDHRTLADVLADKGTKFTGFNIFYEEISLWLESVTSWSLGLFIGQVDIQSLAHAVELTRQGAVDSLRFAKGDLFLAFQVICFICRPWQ